MIDCLTPHSGSLAAERLRALRAANTRLAAELGPALTALLRCPLEVGFAGIDQRTYGEFLQGLRNPTCFSVLRARGLAGTRNNGMDECFLLDLEPAILFPMIDRLLGGGGDDQPPPRPLTEIELPLAARIVRVFIRCVESSWPEKGDRNVLCADHRVAAVTAEGPFRQKVPVPLFNHGAPKVAVASPLSLDLVEVASNPRLLRTLPADERVLTVGFRLGVGQIGGPGVGLAGGAAGAHVAGGMARLCIPCRAVEREAADAGERKAKGPIPAPHSSDRSELAELSVDWTTTQITAEQLAGLRPGDIIATEAAAGGPLVVSLSGEPKFFAKPLSWGGHRAVQITGPVDPSNSRPPGGT
jgi:flagellar motor switch protein FliM